MSVSVRGLVSSLHFRLTAWYCLMLLGTMAALAAVLYLAARRELVSHHDDELVRAARAVVAVIGEHEDCAHLTPEQRARLDDIGGLILVHDVEGDAQVFYRSQETARFPFPQSFLDSSDVSHRAPWFETDRTSAGLVRVYSEPYRSRAGRAGLIRMMEPLGDVEEPLATLRNLMLLLAPVGLLVAFAGGLWLAGHALRPVDHVTSLARDIEAHDLSRRLPEPASTDEMGRLVRTINQMLGRLHSSFEGMKRFTADASHELRTPLASIVSTIDVVLARPRTPEEHESALRSIAEDVQRLRVIVDDLLVLARADAGSVPLRLEPLRLDEIAREVAESFAAAARDAGVDIALESRDGITLPGDEPWLRQLVANLVENAVKFTRPATGTATVRIAVRREGTHAIVTVDDEGPGIAPENLARVFDRFYREEPVASDGTGAGLGLAIARWVAEAHGGSLTATNLSPRGARFTLRLPLAGAPRPRPSPD